MRSEISAMDAGQCSQTAPEVTGDDRGKGIMLFGVRVMTEEGSFRKSFSMNNLAQCDQLQQESTIDVAAGYASDDVVHPSGRSRERKRGVPWSEEEHKLFLLGLQKVGKGDWRGISRNYVKTRTPTQVASHAQKYFIRRNNHNRRRRRSSLFDITTDAVVGSATDDQMYQEKSSETLTTQSPKLRKKEIRPLVVPITIETPMEDLPTGQVNQLNSSPKPIRSIPILPVPPSSKMANLNLTVDPHSNLEPAAPFSRQPPPGRQVSTPPAAGFNGSGGDSMISVA